ncbi:MAG: bifunctional diguanylate cyclase/phosphodiesterase, partial [Oscillospiraceae bacterium]
MNISADKSMDENLFSALEQSCDAIYEVNISKNTLTLIFTNSSQYIKNPPLNDFKKLYAGTILNFIHSDSWDIFFSELTLPFIRKCFSQGGTRIVRECKILCADKKYRWSSCTIIPCKGCGDEIYFCIISDIEKNRRPLEHHVECNILKLEERLKYQMEHDLLTDIYSYKKFYSVTQELIDSNPDTKFVIIYLDIEKFISINDFFGNDRGDKLLVFIADTIKSIFRNIDKSTFGRLESDHFAMCFPHTPDGTEDFIAFLEKEIKSYDIPFEIVPDFGIYTVGDENIPVHLMCDRAKLATEEIKGNYVRRSAYYDESFRNKILKEQQITNSMNQALLRHEFVIYLQPKCNIKSRAVIGAEALVRWNHPTMGIIPPNDFIPIFEANGFIMKLDEYVWEEACRLISRWQKEKHFSIPVSVNVSRVNLHNPNLCDILINLTEKYSISPKLLELEITESAYADNSQLLMSVIKRLRAHGFLIAMDDFGSGYSSLNMLKDFDIDVLKFDLRFLDDENFSGKGGSILCSVVRMAKWLNIPVVAEGIETEEQAGFLKSIDCLTGQGFYYSRPVPVADFEVQFKDNLHSPEEGAPQYFKAGFGMDEIWNPSSPMSLLFNDIFTAIGLYEYSGGHIEALRLNDSYYEMVGAKREQSFMDGIHIIDTIHPHDKEIVN